MVGGSWSDMFSVRGQDQRLKELWKAATDRGGRDQLDQCAAVKRKGRTIGGYDVFTARARSSRIISIHSPDDI